MDGNDGNNFGLVRVTATVACTNGSAVWGLEDRVRVVEQHLVCPPLLRVVLQGLVSEPIRESIWGASCGLGVRKFEVPAEIEMCREA
jgi:hypothetical protein